MYNVHRSCTLYMNNKLTAIDRRQETNSKQIEIVTLEYICELLRSCLTFNPAHVQCIRRTLYMYKVCHSVY